MAQDNEPTNKDTRTDSEQEVPAVRDSRLHYYSGGEVKELADTKISPYLWAFMIAVIIGCLLFFPFGGAMGPHFGGYKPVGGSQASLTMVQQDLNARESGVGTVTTLNLSDLPVPASQTVPEATDAGANVYQQYCIGCHGPNQDGNGVNAAALNPKPRNLRDAPFMQSMSYQRINTSIHKGVPGTAMPRWENTLSEDEIKDVIVYVLSFSAPKPSTTNAATNAASGGSNQYTGSSVQTSPKPITPAINGNPAASTSTAPPSASGQPTGSEPTGQAIGTQSSDQTSAAPSSGQPASAPAAQPAAGTPSAQPGKVGNESVKPIRVEDASPDAGGESKEPAFQVNPKR